MSVVDTSSAEYLAWQQSRRHGLGGSDIAAILGISPWGSPYSVWADKVNDVREEFDPDKLDRLNAGRDAETYLALRFQRETGMHVIGHQTRLVHPKFDWAFAHCDGLACDCPDDEHDDECIDGGWEAKTDNSWTPWEEVPAHYQTQCQWSMWLTGYERWHVTVGFSGWKSQTYVVERDQDDFDLIASEAQRFWIDHVLAGVPPEVDDSDATATALQNSYPREVEGERADVSEFDVTLWATAKAEEADAKRRKTEQQNKIAAALGDAEIGVNGDTPLVTYRAQTRKTTCTECGHTTESKPFRVLREAPKKGNT